MGTGAITGYVDVAQLALYAFWAFFAGLVYYLQRESNREGFPLETDLPDGRTLYGPGVVGAPPPKTYLLEDGSEYQLPNERRSSQPLNARPTHGWGGAPLEPIGDPMTAGVGPGSWSDRADVPDLAGEGHGVRILPLRLVPDYQVSNKDPDPRGMDVTGGDGEVAGVVRDLWLDRSDILFRYLEVEIPGGRHVLVPVNFSRITRRGVHVRAILSTQFGGIPGTKSNEQITRLEEDKIVAYFGAGLLYAEPNRLEPLV